jgi:hypothetical protein
LDEDHGTVTVLPSVSVDEKQWLKKRAEPVNVLQIDVLSVVVPTLFRIMIQAKPSAPTVD